MFNKVMLAQIMLSSLVASPPLLSTTCQQQPTLQSALTNAESLVGLLQFPFEHKHWVLDQKSNNIILLHLVSKQ
jgi:hypothetical protein